MEEKVTKQNILSKFPFINLLTIVIGLGTILIKNSSLPEKLPFFYSHPWGEEQLASRNSLFIIPISSFIIFVLSYQIGKLLQKKEENFLSSVINSCSLLFSVLGTITVLKIVFLIC